MASLTELKISGEQDTLSLLGAMAVRRWKSTIDKVEDNPLNQLFAEVPLKTPHPDPRFAGAISSDYVKVDRIAPLDWIVEIQYRTPDTIAVGGSYNGWAVSVQFETTEESTGRGLPDFDTKSGRKLNDGRLVGSHIYVAEKPPDFTGETPFSAVSTDTLQSIPLFRKQVRGSNVVPDHTQPINHEPQPQRVTRLVLGFTKTVTRFDFGTLRQLGSFANSVNATMWEDFDKATLMFTNCSFSEEVTLNDFGYSEFTYPVRLEFTQNPTGWTPIKLVETWPGTGTGSERTEVIYTSSTRGTRNVVEAEWPWYLGASFDTIFSLAGGTIGQSTPIQPTVRL